MAKPASATSPPGGHPSRRAAVVAAVDLVRAQQARRQQVLHVGVGLVVEHRDARPAEVGDRVDVGVLRPVPHDHLRAGLQRGRDGDGGQLGGVLDRLVGGHQAERDRLVRVQLRADLLEADRRSAVADLEPDARGRAAVDERGGRLLDVRVELRVVAEHLEVGAVLGLGEPVGLHDHRVGAHPGQRTAGGRRRRRGGRGAATAAGRGGEHGQTGGERSPPRGLRHGHGAFLWTPVPVCERDRSARSVVGGGAVPGAGGRADQQA